MTKVSAKRVCLARQRAGEGVELGLGAVQALVAHRPDRRRKAVDVEPAHAARLEVLPPFGELLHVADRPAVRAAAEARHAFDDVAEEGRARHLAVVADIDSAVELAAHDQVHRLVGQRRDPRGIDRPAFGLGHQQVGQHVRPRQAAHMGGQDAIRASLHALALLRNLVIPSAARDLWPALPWIPRCARMSSCLLAQV